MVGLNGSGKSTLLKIMAGQLEDFVGEAWAAEGVRVGYLSQEPELDPSKDVLGNAMEGVAEKKALLDRYNEIAANYSDETADEMAKLQDEIEAQNLWDLDTQVEQALDALALSSGRRGCGEAVGRREAPRGADQAAAGQARHPAAGRADQPSGRRVPWRGWSAISRNMPAASCW